MKQGYGRRMGVVYIQFASEFAHSSKGGDYPACPLPPEAYKSFGGSILRCRRVIMFLCDSRLPSCALRGRPSSGSRNQVTAGLAAKLAVIWAVQLVAGLAARRRRGWRGRKGQPPARREASGEAGGLRSFRETPPNSFFSFFHKFHSSRNGA